MDIVFDCPNCQQELAVDSAGAGSVIECPSCGESITIPAESTKTPTLASIQPAPSLAASPIATSAAAKVEMHLKVPVRNTPGEMLIKKSKPPTEAEAGSATKQIRVHTIRHAQCVESGHDRFDEIITKFLHGVGEANIIGVHTISYSHLDIGTQKLLNDYGLLVIYRG